MNFSAIWRLKLQKFSLWCSPWEVQRQLTKKTGTKLNLLRKTAADKNTWIKACKVTRLDKAAVLNEINMKKTKHEKNL